MSYKKKLIILFVLFLIITSFCFVKHRLKIINHKQNDSKSWVLLEQKFTPDFYTTEEAKRIGENVLYFQTMYGGWSKDICMQNRLYKFDKFIFKYKQSLWRATIDNDATVTEIDYLSKLYNATKNEEYRFSVLRGINYLLNMQYPNGGFPQKYLQITEQYQKEITLNDKAMINIMTLFKKIINNDKQYIFLDLPTRRSIKKAYNLALKCVLDLQLSSGVWAAQYDRETLVPCFGRKFEPPAIDTRESADITIFLMNIENPSQEVIEAIEKSVSWYKENAIKITDFKEKYKDNKYNIIDLYSSEDSNFIWARFYDIDTGVPIFADRDGIIKYDITDISYERIINYKWYINDGNKVLLEYENWKNKLKN